MSSKNDIRMSSEEDRKLEGGEASVPVAKEAPKKDLHPAFYIAYGSDRCVKVSEHF